jgi:hypothetical protein
LGISFSSIPCTCRNQRNLRSLIVSVMVGFWQLYEFFYLLISCNFLLSFPCTGPRILLYTFLSKILNYFPSLFVSVEVSDSYFNVLSIIVFFSINFVFYIHKLITASF